MIYEPEMEKPTPTLTPTPIPTTYAFTPDSTLTRGTLVTILYRYTARREGATTARADFTGFMDAGQISPYAKEPLAWAKAAGLVGGMDWGGIDPQGRATRAQIAAILQRFCEKFIR